MKTIDFVCTLPTHWQFVALVTSQLIIAVVEYWLGRTEKTKAGSILELIINIIKGVFKKGEIK